VVRPEAFAVPQQPSNYTHRSLIRLLCVPVHWQGALPPRVRPAPGRVVETKTWGAHDRRATPRRAATYSGAPWSRTAGRAAPRGRTPASAWRGERCTAL